MPRKWFSQFTARKLYDLHFCARNVLCFNSSNWFNPLWIYQPQIYIDQVTFHWYKNCLKAHGTFDAMPKKITFLLRNYLILLILGGKRFSVLKTGKLIYNHIRTKDRKTPFRFCCIYNYIYLILSSSKHCDVFILFSKHLSLKYRHKKATEMKHGLIIIIIIKGQEIIKWPPFVTMA